MYKRAQSGDVTSLDTLSYTHISTCSPMTQRIWVVTGTSSGFGLAIAKHALSEGDKVS